MVRVDIKPGWNKVFRERWEEAEFWLSTTIPKEDLVIVENKDLKKSPLVGIINNPDALIFRNENDFLAFKLAFSDLIENYRMFGRL